MIWVITRLLAVIIFLSLGASLLAVLDLLHYARFLDKTYIPLLPGISVGCAALVAVLSYMRDKAYQAKESRRKADEIHFKVAKDSFEEIFSLLKDQNNDRIVWIRAARLLLDSTALKEKVKTEDIRVAFDVAEENLRSQLYRALTVHSDEDGSRQPLPPQFFYGIADWKAEESLDNAAKRGGSNIVVGTLTIDRNMREPDAPLLDRKSVVAIFDFLRFPEDYPDRLPGVRIWDEPWENSHGIDQGARRYVAHSRSNIAIDGKLIKVGDKAKVEK